MAEWTDVAEAPLDGKRIAVVSSAYEHSPDHPPEIVTRLQEEYAWFLRLVTNDGRTEVARCEIRSWTGEFDGVFPEPEGGLAAVRWNDQTEAGLILVELGAEPRQLEAAWDTRRTNWLEGPAWTPRLLVLVENPSGAGPWWAEHGPGEADDDDVSPGGMFTPGSIVVLDRQLRELRRRSVDVDVPRGWFPEDDRDRALGAPALVDLDHVAVRVPLAGEQRFAVAAL